MLLTATCFGPQLAIIRLYTLKLILSTMCKYLHIVLSIYLHIVLSINFRVYNLMMAT